MQGPVARDLSELGRERWKIATKRKLDPIEPGDCDWPEGLEPMFEDVDIGISRTRAKFHGQEEITEIEALNLDIIAGAKRFIYFENQYFTSAKMPPAIAKRMAEPARRNRHGDPRTADAAGATGDGRGAAQVDPGHRTWRQGQSLPGLCARTKGGEDIYVHANPRSSMTACFGSSSNLNNRSQGSTANAT